jgi:membrane-associated protein
METVLTTLLAQPSWAVYAVVGLVVLCETALVVGAVVPGETVAIAGGVSAALGQTDLATMVLLVAAAAVAGDAVGWRVGRSLGPRLLEHRWLDRHRRRVEQTRSSLAERGAPAVVVGRWTAFVRSVVPALAGSAGMPYRRFLAWDLVGAVSWAVVSVGVGAMAGESWARVEEWLGAWSVGMVAVVLVAVGVVVVARNARARTGHGTVATGRRRTVRAETTG